MPFVPDDFHVPRSFEGQGFHLEPLGPEHNDRDHEAWMSSIDHIRATPGFDRPEWPVPMTLEQNMDDMVMHFAEFERGEAFTYSILDGDQVIGCVYIYPGTDGTDADVTSWVRATRPEMDPVVRRELLAWITKDWPFGEVKYAQTEDDTQRQPKKKS